VQHVVGDHRWAAAVVSLAGGGVEPFEHGLANILAFGLGHRAKNANNTRSVPVES
jgi:hypothetical protein